jgi:K+ transporter
MTDHHGDDVIQDAHPARGIMFDLRDNGWTGRLVLYLRAVACVSMLQGLYHWAEVTGIIGEEGGFEAHVQSWQATTAFFAVIDLVAAVGLWLVAPWGAVVWLTATVSMIVVQLFFDQVYGTSIVTVVFGALLITGYLTLAVLAAREHPR